MRGQNWVLAHVVPIKNILKEAHEDLQSTDFHTIGNSMSHFHSDEYIGGALG